MYPYKRVARAYYYPTILASLLIFSSVSSMTLTISILWGLSGDKVIICFSNSKRATARACTI